MEEVLINNQTFRYEHVPIIASSNVLTGTRYFTKVFLGTYFLGEIDGKADEYEIEARVKELLETTGERQYGTQRTLLRRDLPTRSGRGNVTRGISGSILGR